MKTYSTKLLIFPIKCTQHHEYKFRINPNQTLFNKTHHTADLFLVCICDVTSPTPIYIYIYTHIYTSWSCQDCADLVVKTVLTWCFLNPWAIVQGHLALFPTFFLPSPLIHSFYKHIPSFSYAVCMISSKINKHFTVHVCSIKMIALRTPRAVTYTHVSVS